MAGGKETPRQKMIGMMYLVLTALLALNVSKQIVSAFITLNDKLSSSAQVIGAQAGEYYGQIQQKKAALNAMEADMTDFNLWEQKSIELKQKTNELNSFLLSECNEMIKAVEGEDWIESYNEDGTIKSLKSLDKMQNIDNYDVPTHLFVGGDPNNPNERGTALVAKIHEYRNFVSELLGTYSTKSKSFEFIAPNSIEDLQASFDGANTVDTSVIRQFYKTLTIPDYLHAHETGELMPWLSVTFDHAPVVAAAAMFTSLQLDLKNAEAMAAEFIVDKIDAPIFDFNKIEPMAIAPTQYINSGDSIPLRIMIAAYDSNEVATIKYGQDADTLAENWTETSGVISLRGQQPGQHVMKGVIGVQERGETQWKPWDFTYTVGQPMGVVAQPEMRILYIGYDNVVEATASGFQAENVSMKGQGCRIVKQGNKYVAKVERGTRSATINVVGTSADGSFSTVGSYQYKCVPLPDAIVSLGRIKNGDEISYQRARDLSNCDAVFPEGVNLDVDFRVTGGFVKVEGVTKKGRILDGGVLDSDAKSALRQSRGKDVIVGIDYRDPSGTGKKAGLTFSVRR